MNLIQYFLFFNTFTFKQTPDVNITNIGGRVNNGSKRNPTIISEAKRPLNCLNVYKKTAAKPHTFRYLDTQQPQ